MGNNTYVLLVWKSRETDRLVVTKVHSVYLVLEPRPGSRFILRIDCI